MNQYGSPKLNPACTLEKTARDGFLAAMRALDPKVDKDHFPPWVLNDRLLGGDGFHNLIGNTVWENLRPEKSNGQV